MLPFELPWYRRLLGFAVVLGIAGAVCGTVYLGATGAAIDEIFGEAGTDWWSGEWWWIPLVTVGGLVLASLRLVWRVPDRVPGGVGLIEAGEVDHTTAAQWVVLAGMSAIFGASLGPSFALVVMGGALGSWIAERRYPQDDAGHDYTLTGIAGGFGAAFTSPILGAFMVSELGPIPRTRYVAAIIPQMIAATVGFALFYAVAGRTFLGSYDLPEYAFQLSDIAVAVALGVVSAVVMMTFAVITIGARRLTQLVPNPYVRGPLFGFVVGVIAVALPLTLGAGQSQLGTVVDGAFGMGAGLVVATVLAKMVAVALSLEAGFMGGNVFPLIFIGGSSGVAVYLMFPEIPFALAVSCMLAAVPGSYLRAPVSLSFIAAIALSLGPENISPVVVAVITSYLVVGIVRYLYAKRTAAAAQPA